MKFFSKQVGSSVFAKNAHSFVNNNKDKSTNKVNNEDTSLESRQKIAASLHKDVVGEFIPIKTPFGEKALVYADHTASGRCLHSIEKYISKHVLPLYANTHTTASACGRQMTFFRHEARELVHKFVNGDQRDIVVFSGTGVTGCMNKVVRLLGLEGPGPLHYPNPETIQRWLRRHDRNADVSGLQEFATKKLDKSGQESPVVVFIGPFEHHSNILPWRESCAKVVTIEEQPGTGMLDIQDLVKQLEAHKHIPIKIGSFSAASNVTGVVTDVNRVTKLLHDYGAISMWDYACGAPHLKIDMNPVGHDSLDAVFFSPHKLEGGPQTPGVVVLKRHLFDLGQPPTDVGGGTVVFVTPDDQQYTPNPEDREEGGTPGIVQAIRCGLVAKLYDSIGFDLIMQRERAIVQRVLAGFAEEPNICLLGPNNPDIRLPVFPILVRSPFANKFLHYNFVCVLLNDLFGIQTRGGCSCAGPYVQLLLGLDLQKTHDYERELATGIEIFRPGFTRVSLGFQCDDETVDYIIRAVQLIARKGYHLLNQYEISVSTGECRHISDTGSGTQKTLTQVGYQDGQMVVRRSGLASRNLYNSPAFTKRTNVKQWYEKNLRWAEAAMDAAGREPNSKIHDDHVFTEGAEKLRWFVLARDLNSADNSNTVSPQIYSNVAAKRNLASTGSFKVAYAAWGSSC